jgi:hypothetical protein
MRMAVQTGGLSVSSPSGVCNSGVRNKSGIHVGLRLVDELLKLSNLSDLLESKDFVLLVAIYGTTSRVVPSVFKTTKT